MVFVIGFTSYAILRYRLMDIRVIIRRSAVFAVLVLAITSLYALLAYITSNFFQELIGTSSVVLNGVITAVLVAFGFEPLKKWLSLATDKYLFKAEYDPQLVLTQVSDKLSSTLDLDILSDFLTDKLNRVFKCSFVSLFLLDEKSRQYVRTSVAGKVQGKVDKIDKKLFSSIHAHLKEIGKEKDIFVREEIKKLNEELPNPILELYYEELDKYGVNLVVPLYIQEKLLAILFLGDKKSGDVYSQQDIRILEIIASHAAVSIQNSQLFEEQKKFTIYLKREVEKATKELRSANIQLKKLDKAKSEFISIASHQLRTPLTVIKGYISMINQGDFGKINKPIVNPLDRVYKSTLRIIDLVEDLLNISRIESGRMKYELNKVDLADIVKNVFDELEQHAKSKGLKLIYQPPKQRLPDIIIDDKKIREVVMNIMDNAIKYTPKGQITVSLTKDKEHLTYCVSDTGRGITEDEMPLLFQKFSRAGGAKLVHTEGTGLGLYIAKQIVAKHGGKIWAESAGRDKGSKFCMQLKINNPKLVKEMKENPIDS